MIKFENITATYTEKVGIFNLSFHIPQGELVFLMGPTGAGKSTVLKTIYRDIPIADGTLYINGEDAKEFIQNLISNWQLFLFNQTLL